MNADGVRMSCIQFWITGILSAIPMFLFEKPSLSAIFAAAVPLLYAGVMSSGVAYTLQIVAQKDADPTVASLILSLESVFSVLAGWVVLGQVMSMREICGCVLMFAAIILAQLPESINLIFGGSGIVPAALFAIILNIILPKDEKTEVEMAEEILAEKKEMESK